MVTPVTRRRPQKLARSTVSLDRLANGRTVFGVGLGADTSRELSAFGEDTEPPVLGRRLDEGLELLVDLWSGNEVSHRGDTFHRRPCAIPANSRPAAAIPVWWRLATRTGPRCGEPRGHEGLFPIELDHPDQLVEMLDVVAGHRGSSAPLAVATHGAPDEDPQPWADAGATWWLVRFDPFTVSVDHVRGVIAGGPPAR